MAENNGIPVRWDEETNKIILMLKDNSSYNKEWSIDKGDESKEVVSSEEILPKLEGILKRLDSIRSIKKLDKDEGVVQIGQPDAKDDYELNRIDKKDYLYDIVNDRVQTHNWIGVYELPGEEDQPSVRVEISSRFDTSNRQYFLLYLLSHVYGFNVYRNPVGSIEHEDFDAVLCVFFLEKVKIAFKDGLFKVYKSFECNDFNFKGRFDVSRHIRINTPFVGKTAYTVREFTYDNDILCLIRQGIDYVKSNYSELWDSYVDESMYEIENVLESATPSYSMNTSYVDRNLCRNEVSHPLYEAYEDVRVICRRLLRDSGDNVYDDQDAEAFALLIDVAWLWEEFVALCLLNAGKNKGKYRHLRTKSGHGKDCIHYAKGEHNKWFPDYLENVGEEERRNVFDAKYKRWHWNREDMHQMLAYLYITGGTRCGFIYPQTKEEKSEEESGMEENEKENAKMEKVLNPFSGFYDKKTKVICRKYPFIVPTVPTGKGSSPESNPYEEYCKMMEASINYWCKNFE